MDLSAKQTRLLCLPTGAFFDTTKTPPWHSPQDIALNELFESRNVSSEVWENSTTNPSRRIETLDPVSHPRWRIDGSDNQGSLLFIIPLFMRHPTPMRIDLHIPSQDRHPPNLRIVLDSAWLFAIRDGRVANLGLARHVSRALESWLDDLGEAAVEDAWKNAPFGSRIVVDRITSNPKNMKFRIINDFEFERRMLSLETLKDMWKFPTEIYPHVIDIKDLTLLNQLHDTISIVSLPSPLELGQVVFKSSIHDVKFLYHELKLLLSMPRHPHIMPKPLYLVSGKDRYGGEDKIFGFILPYIVGGNLADSVSRRKQYGILNLHDQFRWARQVVETLQFINLSPARFYSELKADNLLLDGCDNIVFIDFEQIGNWITYSAPEIHYFEYCMRLAYSNLVPEKERQQFRKIMTALMPEREKANAYDNPKDGYYDAWNILTPKEREAAEVYSVGKLIWCIFEGCADTRNSSLKAFRFDTGQEFPEFCRTPSRIRDLIMECVTSYKDGDPGRTEVIRVGNKVIPRFYPNATEREVMLAAKEMWRIRVQDMSVFMEARLRWMHNDLIPGDEVILGYPMRPSLDYVLRVLKEEEQKLCS